MIKPTALPSELMHINNLLIDYARFPLMGPSRFPELGTT